MDHDKDFSYDAVIPSALLFNKNIEPAAIKFYAMVRSLSRIEGYCYATNKYLAQCMECNESTIKRHLKSLVDEGFLESEIECEGIHTNRKIYISDKFKNVLRRCKNEPPPAQNCATPSSKMSHRLEENNNKGILDNNSLVPISRDATDIALHLKDKINKLHPKLKTPDDLTNWSNEIDVMMRRDQRTKEEIIEMIDWAMDDAFWWQNVRSPSGLRRNWDKMLVKRIQIDNSGTRKEKNKEIAYNVKTFLNETKEGDKIYITNSGVKNTITKDFVSFNLPETTFEDILCGWFKLKRKK